MNLEREIVEKFGEKIYGYIKKEMRDYGVIESEIETELLKIIDSTNDSAIFLLMASSLFYLLNTGIDNQSFNYLFDVLLKSNDNILKVFLYLFNESELLLRDLILSYKKSDLTTFDFYLINRVGEKNFNDIFSLNKNKKLARKTIIDFINLNINLSEFTEYSYIKFDDEKLFYFTRNLELDTSRIVSKGFYNANTLNILSIFQEEYIVSFEYFDLLYKRLMVEFDKLEIEYNQLYNEGNE